MILDVCVERFVVENVNIALKFALLQLFINQGAADKLQLFESSGERFYDKQESHTVLTSQLVERHLKTTLLDLTSSIFGEGPSAFYFC